jgi:phosphatidylserine decarboxylase
MNIAQGSLSWIAISFIFTGILFCFSYFISSQLQYVCLFISLLMLLLSIALVIFFRDPTRSIGSGIIAVADGMIREITDENDSDVGKCTKISTFMNIHNVHVNRMPLDGTVSEIVHFHGSHLPAFKKESEKNERVNILIKSKIGAVKIILIAGTIARRIVPYIEDGAKVKKGEKIGLIRLGSRVDIYLPRQKIQSISVKEKDKVRAGEDTIAHIND